MARASPAGTVSGAQASSASDQFERWADARSIRQAFWASLGVFIAGEGLIGFLAILFGGFPKDVELSRTLLSGILCATVALAGLALIRRRVFSLYGRAEVVGAALAFPLLVSFIWIPGGGSWSNLHWSAVVVLVAVLAISVQRLWLGDVRRAAARAVFVVTTIAIAIVASLATAAIWGASTAGLGQPLAAFSFLALVGFVLTPIVGEGLNMGAQAGAPINQTSLIAARPEVVSQALIASATGARRYELTIAEPGTILLTRRYRPTWTIVVAVVGFFLFFFGPLALLYKRTETLTISLAGIEGGTRLSITGAATPEMLMRIAAAIAALPQLPESGATGTGADRAGALATKTCPQCAETVKIAAKICRFCGHEFENPSRLHRPPRCKSQTQRRPASKQPQGLARLNGGSLGACRVPTWSTFDCSWRSPLASADLSPLIGNATAEPLRKPDAASSDRDVALSRRRRPRPSRQARS